MAYGILKSTIVTDNGDDSNLLCKFVAPLAVISEQPAYIQESMNLSINASSQGVQRWNVVANIEPSNDNANFLTHTTRNGHTYKFKIRTPQVANLKTAAGTLVEKLPNGITTSSAAANASVVSVAAGAYYTAGEFIQFGALDTKVYMVSESTDLGSVSIFPNLRMAMPSNTPVYRGSKVMMTVRYNQDVRLGITYIDGVLSDPGSITFIEAL